MSDVDDGLDHFSKELKIQDQRIDELEQSTNDLLSEVRQQQSTKP